MTDIKKIAQTICKALANNTYKWYIENPVHVATVESILREELEGEGLKVKKPSFHCKYYKRYKNTLCNEQCDECEELEGELHLEAVRFLEDMQVSPFHLLPLTNQESAKDVAGIVELLKGFLHHMINKEV